MGDPIQESFVEEINKGSLTRCEQQNLLTDLVAFSSASDIEVATCLGNIGDRFEFLLEDYDDTSTLELLFLRLYEERVELLERLAALRGTSTHLMNFLFDPAEVPLEAPIVAVIRQNSSSTSAGLIGTLWQRNLASGCIETWVQRVSQAAMDSQFMRGMASVFGKMLKQSTHWYRSCQLIFQRQVMPLCRDIRELRQSAAVTHSTLSSVLRYGAQMVREQSLKYINAPAIVDMVLIFASTNTRSADVDFELASDAIAYFTELGPATLDATPAAPEILCDLALKCMSTTSNSDLWVETCLLLDMIWFIHKPSVQWAVANGVVERLVKRGAGLPLATLEDDRELHVITCCLQHVSRGHGSVIAGAPEVLGYLGNCVDAICRAEEDTITRAYLEVLNEIALHNPKGAAASIAQLVLLYGTREGLLRDYAHAMLAHCLHDGAFVKALADRIPDGDMGEAILIHFPEDLIQQICDLKAQEQDAPEEFVDPISCAVMTDPVQLPQRGASDTPCVLDRATVLALPKGTRAGTYVNPYTREEFGLDAVEEAGELKQKIDAWMAR